MTKFMPATATVSDVPASLESVFADDNTFRAWYEATLPRVYRYLYHRCGRSKETAEELTQETFAEAIRSRGRFDGGDSIAWLIGIARHRLIDHLRRIERREHGLMRFLVLQPPQVLWLAEEADADRLAAVLSRLPAAQRAAVVLRYLDDLSVREVARLMGRSEKAVESLLSRARGALRRSYGESGDE